MRKDFSKKNRFIPFLIVGIILLACDMASKFWAYQELSLYGEIPVFSNVWGIDFSILRAMNSGGAWSLFSSFPIVLLIVRIAIFIGLVTYALFLNEAKKRRIPLLLIVTGALGNILDCFFYGSVVDMLSFNLWGYGFPVFNVADSLIFLGVATLMLQSLFKKKKKHALTFSN